MDEILARIADDPDVIATFTADEVEQAKQALLEVADKAEGEALDDIAAVTELVTARETELAELAEQRAARLASIRESLGVADTEDVTEEAETVDEAEPVEPVEEAETVAASAQKRPALKAIAARAPKDEAPPAPAVTLTGKEGRREGKTYSNKIEFAADMIHAAKTSALRGKQAVASFDTLAQHKYVIQDPDSASEAMKVFEQVTRDAEQSNQPGVGALTAAGGFCAPAEPRYEFFNIATQAGLLNLPTVGAARGAVTYPVSPSLADFFPGVSGIATEWTNDNDINPSDPSTKPVYTFVCPENVECEVIAWPTILQFGNFAARFYPEAVANATALAMVASARTVNAARIAAIEAAAVVLAPEDTGAGGLVQVITNLASAASDYRNRYGMAPTATLDVAAPSWVPDALVADAIARDSTVDYGDLRRRVLAALADLNLRVQWVYDLDDAGDNLFPQSATFLLWAPGTIIELDGGTLDLGVVRDSTLNATNDYQTFVEPFVGWCFPGHEVISVTIEVCPTGGTGARVTIPCPAVS